MMFIFNTRRQFCLISLFLLVQIPVFAQLVDSILTRVDSNYISTYEKQFVGRIFSSQKYTSLVLGREKDLTGLQYRPNTTLNLGIGFTYRAISLNLAYGFSFLNNDEGKGKTRYLDLQTHFYSREWTMDFYGQFYKGYYLFPKGNGNDDNSAYYSRPDLNVNLFGLAVYKVINSKKFSYRAALIQSEWQKKSAGTWLIGGEAYTGKFRADSTLVPSLLTEKYPGKFSEKVQFVELGPGGGYAYTLVFLKKWFLMGSATVNLGFGMSREFNFGIHSDKFSISPNLVYRGAMGFNSNAWSVSATWVGNTVFVRGASSTSDYRFNTGNYRFTVAHRFKPGPRLSKKTKWLDSKPTTSFSRVKF